MNKVAVFGGTGYLASLIKNQNNFKKNKFFFFSRKESNLVLKKNLKYFKNFNTIIHLIGPNQYQLFKNKNLIKKKSQITSNICDICLENNIKLIYISSMQIYKNYGKQNICLNSKINTKNPYSKAHYESEKIILKKFDNHKNMFLILRMGNVFGFRKYENLKELKNNLIHNFCILAFKKNKIVINNGSVQRSFVPSIIFINIINNIIKKKLFKNSIINISYKNCSLKNIAHIIKKRMKILYNLKVDTIIKKPKVNKNYIIYNNKYFKFKNKDKNFNTEIQQILIIIRKFIKKY